MKKRWIVCILSLCMCLFGCQGSSKSEFEDSLLLFFKENTSLFDQMTQSYVKAVDAFEKYNNEEITGYELVEVYNEANDTISNIEPLECNEEILSQCDTYGHESAEYEAYTNYIQINKDSYLRDIDYLYEFCATEGTKSKYTDTIIDIFDKYDEEDVLNYWYNMNESLLLFDDEEGVENFKNELKQTSTFKDYVDKWSNDKDELEKLSAACSERQEEYLTLYSEVIGEQKDDLQETKKQFVQFIMEEYDASEDEALAYYDSWKELQDVYTALDQKKEELYEAKKPTEEDTETDLITKAAMFAGYNMYDEAAECAEMLSNVDTEYFDDESIESLTHFYNICFKDEDYGVIVLKPIEDKDLGSYKEGDVIVQIDGNPIYNEDSYTQAKEVAGDEYTVTVLRLNDEGKFEVKSFSVPTSLKFYHIEINDRDFN